MKDEAIKIENEFDILFKSINYERVDNYVGKSPNFSNADYISLEKKVVIELKVLDKDFFEEGGIVDCIQGIIPVPKDIEEDGQGFYEIKIPKRDRNGKVDTLEEPLRRIIKKANKQLKETNQRLLDGKGKGFMVLAINMKTTINPEIIRAITIKILRKEFLSINAVVFCTPKVGLILNNGFFQPIILHCQDSNLSEEFAKELIFIVNSWAYFINNGGHS